MSEVKVNKISPRTNCGTTTLGDSGDTFTIPAGVTITNNGTQTGFGRTGAVDWQTGSIKTATFTASNGEGYFCNTTSSAFTVNLPSSPSAGNIVAVSDYANNFNTNNLTIGRGGSNIEGSASDLVLTISGTAMTFVYVDGTKGWKVVGAGKKQDGQSATYISASGGTITEDGDFKVHTFTGPGTFTVCSVGNVAGGGSSVDYLVIAGGGGGGTPQGGGGGAGGYRESSGAASGCYTRSPLGACVSAVPVSSQAYPIVVGGGGGTTSPGGPVGSNGNTSSALGISSAGGGTATFNCQPSPSGGSGSGAPGGGSSGYPRPGGAGNTPPVSPPQGNAGGACPANFTPNRTGGGGGGATAAGAAAASGCAGNGGTGATSSINGTPTQRAGGGGGGGQAGSAGTASGGGGAGGIVAASGTAGTANTGGGGGGSAPGNCGANGGSGIVVIRYKFQN